ncbi:MAG: right-handed parallel beta-helix repeat-containing protein [Sedimentisphaerales bacterium]|nr:right-handed parallel beta-helix repeat-containing protein [Sedimentisphaerales bacterium]
MRSNWYCEDAIVKKAICILVFVLAAITCRAKIITVDDDGAADFNNIQAAIYDANGGDVVEVQPGRYTGLGNRDIDFLGKAITVRSTNPTSPEVVAQTIIDCNSSGRAFLFHTNEDANSILDGLTIINGCSSAYGGAIYCTQTSPTIKNCTFARNVASWAGAVYGEDSSSVVIRDCLFTDNSAKGAGAINYYESNGVIAGCIFRNNCATDNKAGAVRIRGGNITITDCVFQGNYAFPDDFARGFGGALAVALSEVSVTKCLFVGNWAAKGGVFFCEGTEITFANCTFAYNYASEGNTLIVVDPAYGPASTFHMRNSIIWDGPDSFVLDDHSNLLVSFCDIPGAWPGYGNIDTDPCFVDPGYWDPNGTPEDANDDFFVPGDYHLKSQGGRWDAERQVWVRDDSTSPCIDAGDPNISLGQEPFPNGGRINIGVYGGTAEASKSYFGKAPCETIVAGDINGDCVVNFIDFVLLSDHWFGRNVYPMPARLLSPPDGQEDVGVWVTLRWQAYCYPPRISPTGELDPESLCAVSHDIYLGTDYTALRDARSNSPQYKGNMPASWDLENECNFGRSSELDVNTTYYWRIDTIAANGTITFGYIWSFTISQVPYRATEPDPPDGSFDVPANAILSWRSGQLATSHKIYFGTTNPPPFQTTQVQTTFFPGPLAESTTYYWRVDELNDYRIMHGTTWSFTTGVDSP